MSDGIEQKVEAIDGKVDSIRDTVSNIHDTVVKLNVHVDSTVRKASRHEAEIYGNKDSPGLRADVHQLKADNQRRDGNIKMLWSGLVATVVAVVGSVVSAVMSWIHKP